MIPVIRRSEYRGHADRVVGPVKDAIVIQVPLVERDIQARIGRIPGVQRNWASLVDHVGGISIGVGRGCHVKDGHGSRVRAEFCIVVGDPQADRVDSVVRRIEYGGRDGRGVGNLVDTVVIQVPLVEHDIHARIERSRSVEGDVATLVTRVRAAGHSRGRHVVDKPDLIVLDFTVGGIAGGRQPALAGEAEPAEAG